MIETGTAAELKHRVGGERIEVALEHPADAPRVVEVLAPLSVGGRRSPTTIAPSWYRSRRSQGMVPIVVRELDEATIGVEDVGIRRSTSTTCSSR